MTHIYKFPNSEVNSPLRNKVGFHHSTATSAPLLREQEKDEVMFLKIT